MPFSASVVICTLGRTELLASTLAGVLRTEPPPMEVVVADGDPAGGAAEVVHQLDPRGRLLRHLPSPRGLTKQRNHALRAVSGDVVVFLDDDVQIPVDTFARLSRAFEDQSLVAATGWILEPDGGRLGGKRSLLRRLLPGGADDGGFTRFGYPRHLTRPDREQDVSFMQGCFMAVRTDVAREIGFDEALPGYGLAEDEDFSYRVSKVGRILHLPDLRIEHANTGFLTRDQRAFGRAVVVNRAHLFRKNFPQTWPARIQFWMLILMFVGHRVVNREWAGARGLLEGARQVLGGSR